MKPDWLIVKGTSHKERQMVAKLLSDLKLNTVCHEAACPNMVECYGRKTATFMILGAQCTRGCTFCNVNQGEPIPPNLQEPESVAEAVKRLGLLHVVITSVTRDDLEDGGAAQFAATIEAIGKRCPDTTIEVLIPDLKGDSTAIETIIKANPEVIAHNVETIPTLYKQVRPDAIYERSLAVLKNIKSQAPSIYTKSGIMLGLGELYEQVIAVLKDLRNVGCDFVTIGQYLAPSHLHHPVIEYIEPLVFEKYKQEAYKLGFAHVASGPLVRSSYHADHAINIVKI